MEVLRSRFTEVDSLRISVVQGRTTFILGRRVWNFAFRAFYRPLQHASMLGYTKGVMMGLVVLILLLLLMMVKKKMMMMMLMTTMMLMRRRSRKKRMKRRSG